MGRLELFLSEVSWHAGVLERMAWPCARPDGFSSPSLLSVYSRCTLTFTSLLSPCLHLARSRSPTGFVMKVSERASICASSRPGSHFLSAPRLQWFAEPRTLFSTDPVIPLWRHNSSNEPRLLSPPVSLPRPRGLRASSDAAPALMITGPARLVAWMTPRRQRRAKVSLPVVFWWKAWGKRRDGGESFTVRWVYVFVPTVWGRPV